MDFFCVCCLFLSVIFCGWYKNDENVVSNRFVIGKQKFYDKMSYDNDEETLMTFDNNNVLAHSLIDRNSMIIFDNSYYANYFLGPTIDALSSVKNLKI